MGRNKDALLVGLAKRWDMILVTESGISEVKLKRGCLKVRSSGKLQQRAVSNFSGDEKRDGNKLTLLTVWQAPAVNCISGG
jgi:hypothetical protein